MIGLARTVRARVAAAAEAGRQLADAAEALDAEIAKNAGVIEELDKKRDALGRIENAIAKAAEEKQKADALRDAAVKDLDALKAKLSA